MLSSSVIFKVQKSQSILIFEALHRKREVEE